MSFSWRIKEGSVWLVREQSSEAISVKRLVRRACPREHDGSLLPLCSQSKVSLLSAAVAQANLQQVQWVSPQVAVFSRQLMLSKNTITVVTEYNIWQLLTWTLSKRGRMKSSVKGLLSFLSRRKTPVVFEFSVQSESRGALKINSCYNNIREKSTCTSFQSLGTHFVLAEKEAFLLSAKDRLFLFVGSRVLTCLLACLFLMFKSQGGFHDSYHSEHGKVSCGSRLVFITVFFCFKPRHTRLFVYVASLAAFECCNSKLW